jgi:hypothetical protein
MMDLHSIKQANARATRTAKSKKAVPLVLAELEDVDNLGTPGYIIPNLGDHCPAGWELLETWFCDSSGFSGENEPALTLGQLKEKMKDCISAGNIFGYGIVECGQFQLHLGVYQKKSTKKISS